MFHLRNPLRPAKTNRLEAFQAAPELCKGELNENFQNVAQANCRVIDG